MLNLEKLTKELEVNSLKLDIDVLVSSLIKEYYKIYENKEESEETISLVILLSNYVFRKEGIFISYESCIALLKHKDTSFCNDSVKKFLKFFS